MTEYEIDVNGAVITVTSKDAFNLFVTSDIHFDGINCHRQQFFADLDHAILMNAHIAIIGDLFDAMNGRFDPRRSMELVRPEYRKEAYYDAIVDDTIMRLKPYAEHILFIAPGNHESAVLKNANTDMIKRLVKGLSTPEHEIVAGGYGGLIMMKAAGGNIPIKYFHGSGGEAPVTRGAIQTNRQAVYLPDFQVILNGHSHHMYWIPIVRERLDLNGRHYFDIQHHIRTPGYVMNYGDGSQGWEVMRGGVPKPMGSYIINFFQNDIEPMPLISVPLPITPSFDVYDGVEFPQE